MSTCQEFVEVVTAYLEGGLSSEDEARFEHHVELCPGCGTYVAQIRETVALSGGLREEDLAPAARDALLTQFRSWKTETA